MDTVCVGNSSSVVLQAAAPCCRICAQKGEAARRKKWIRVTYRIGRHCAFRRRCLVSGCLAAESESEREGGICCQGRIFMRRQLTRCRGSGARDENRIQARVWSKMRKPNSEAWGRGNAGDTWAMRGL